MYKTGGIHRDRSHNVNKLDRSKIYIKKVIEKKD